MTTGLVRDACRGGGDRPVSVHPSWHVQPLHQPAGPNVSVELQLRFMRTLLPRPLPQTRQQVPRKTRQQVPRSHLADRWLGQQTHPIAAVYHLRQRQSTATVTMMKTACFIYLLANILAGQRSRNQDLEMRKYHLKRQARRRWSPRKDCARL